MTGKGHVKALEEKEPRLFDDETIHDYLIQRSNELEHEAMMINETLKLIRELNLKSQNQSSLSTCEKCGKKVQSNEELNAIYGDGSVVCKNCQPTNLSKTAVIVCPVCLKKLDSKNKCPQCKGKFDGPPLDKRLGEVV